MAYTGPLTPGTKVNHIELGPCTITGFGPSGLTLEPDTEEGKQKLLNPTKGGVYSYYMEANMDRIEKLED